MKRFAHIAAIAGVLTVTACAGEDSAVMSTADDNAMVASSQEAEPRDAQAGADLQELERLAGLGDAGAQYELALAYEIGSGVARDATEARRWYLRAAAGGNREAQYKAGLYYEGGHTVPRDLTESLNWYRRAAAQDHPLAGRRVSELERKVAAATAAAIAEVRAKEVEPAVAAYEGRDYATAYQEFNRLAGRGNAGAQYHLGLMYDIGSGVPADADLARQWYVTAAWNGYADAQYRVGAMNEFGYLVTKNAQGALMWYRQAAAQGHRLAQRRVEEIERTLVTTPRQDTAAMQGVATADTVELVGSGTTTDINGDINGAVDSADATAGTTDAMGAAAVAVDSSQSLAVPVAADAEVADATPAVVEPALAESTDPSEPGEIASAPEPSASTTITNTLVADVQAALAAYDSGENANPVENARRLAERGDPEAQYDLGVMYAKGEGTAEDIARAARWYRRAADQGVAKAQYDLGVLYSEGRGVEKDDDVAANLYRKAARQGLVEAQAKLDQMVVALPVAQKSPNQNAESPAKSNVAQLSSPIAPAAAQPLKEYRIGAGDRINMIVFGHEDLSGEFLVDGSGKVSLPLLGQVNAYNKTVAEFQTDITTALDRDFIVNPRVSVEVINYRPFFILGQVNNPGSYSYIEGMTARMAVALAGGFTRRARESTVVVVRASDPEQNRVSVGLETPVLPGDTIEVERRLF